ncbi:hypothetical protein Sme01_43810 [Sphaerisporangium melleum]|uniref:DUF1707 domain-containing protein n=3 Tax=Sphaerisporangium melleum TaxID=321316 RepID=A0A917QYK8_9ACTN|nr:hypothetical protein GCM10007964_20770 [Sphaerisporangium melleum]GII71905.1 hypothetical protein Sme01_43810 [Sphaerisporangium melleum]
MAATPDMRASDGDRDRVAAVLREHCAQGRLTMEEFNERLELVYAGRTYGDLQKLTADLPDIDLNTLPAAQAPEQRRVAKMHPGLKAAWTSWASAFGVCSVIYAMTDFGGYFWPMWVGGPWGVILLVSTLSGSAPQEGKRKGKKGKQG